MKASARATWPALLGAALAFVAGPLFAEDDAAAARQYKAAMAFQVSEAYDLAADEWGKFIEAYPSDSRAIRARHYRGICYFRLAVAALDAKQLDAARKLFDAAEQSFDAVIKGGSGFNLLEETYLFRGLGEFKRATIEPHDEAARRYRAAAADFDAIVKNYPQSKYLAQVLYARGDCAYYTGQ